MSQIVAVTTYNGAKGASWRASGHDHLELQVRYTVLEMRVKVVILEAEG